MSIFDERKNYKPFEYPEIDILGQKLTDTFWTHKELTFEGDKVDFHNLSENEKEIVLRTLTLIATIEVKVKDFWGQIGNHFPKPEIKELGAIASESECYDPETEVLTKKGFKYFSEITYEDELAAYDINTRTIEFEKPSSILVKDYSGPMHHYFSKRTDLMVTENHNVVTINPHSKNVRLVPSNSGKWANNYKYPAAGFKGGYSTLTYLDRLIIAIQADGTLMGATPSGKESGRMDFCFNFKKKRKFERLVFILEQLSADFKHSLRKNNGFYTINGTLEGLILPEQVHSIKNFDYFSIEHVNANWGREFIDELSFWDGSTIKNGTVYYNTNKDAIDKVTIIATLSGFSTNMGVNYTVEKGLKTILPDGKQKNNCKTVYCLSINNRNEITYPTRTVFDYEGKVYCATVSTGALVTRRNKRVAVSGNCRHTKSYDRLLEVLNMSDYYNKALENEFIMGRFNYLDKYLKLSPHNSDKSKYLLKLILFSVLIENVSLFSQFATVMYFFRHRGIMKDIRNIIKWTAIDELNHFNIGVVLTGILRTEFPEMFTEELQKEVHKACIKAVKYETELLGWVFENGELPNMSKQNLHDYMKSRINESMTSLGFETIFDDIGDLKPLDFFYEEVFADSQDDFFAVRSTDYTLKDKPITGDDLF